MNNPAKPMESTQQDQDFTGADAVIACLKHQGVDVVFGMVGGAIMPVYDALYRDGSIRHLIVGHEQGAAHMASGYARTSGRPGVVMTTSGPGATNLVTGLADAMMDSTAMVAITGQVVSGLLGNDAFQEADMRGITMPITKHNYQLSSTEELPEVLAEAFFVALSGRPGPVLIDLPRDLGLAPAPPSQAVPLPPSGYKPPYRGNPLQIEKALELLGKAKRPVILAGGGVITAGASDELMGLVRACGAPVTSTLMGLGNFPHDHELSLGMPGMHGTGYANLALYHADVILVVGSRLDDRITGKLDQFAPEAQLIHVDVDDSEIGKNLECAVPVVGDAKPVLKALAQGAVAWDIKPNLSAWYKQIQGWKKKFPMVYPEHPGVLAPQRVIQTMGEMLNEDTVIVTGVGQHQMFTAQYYPFRRPGCFLTSGGLGTMGYGLPAAMGAKLGRPEAEVVLIDGDGSFLMNIQELATAVRYKVPLVAVVLNNNYLGMVRQWQDRFFERRKAETDLKPPPFHEVAKAFGGMGRRVTDPGELETALDWGRRQAAEHSLPVVLEVAVEPAADVLPMVPPGGANADFIPCEGKEE